MTVTWVDLVKNMLNEISRTETVKNHMISLMCDVKLKATNEHTRKTNKKI